jgi:RHS repeat-associated protein
MSLTPYQLAGSTVTYLLTDHLGSPVREADAAGNITASFSYRPYGSLATGPNQNQPGFTEHVNDPETQFTYMQARYYDLGVGRFLSVDPVGPSPGNLYNFNRYDYANNNPVNNTDPSGDSTVYTYPSGIVVVVQTFNNQTAGKTNIPISDLSIVAQGDKFSGETNGHYMSVVLQPGNDSDSVQIKVDSSLHDHDINGVPSSHRSNSDLGKL